MTSSFTQNISLEKPANGDYNNTWNIPVNADWDVVDQAVGGRTTFNVVGKSGTVAIALTEYRSRILIFSGILTANVNYQFPAGVGGTWYVYNNTTGSFTITLSSATGGGTSLVVAQGYTSPVVCDGTNVGFGVTAPIPLANGLNPINTYTAAGFFGTTAGTNPSITATTPNNGNVGGIRLIGNATSGNSIFQITDSAGTTQYGLISGATNGVITIQSDGASGYLAFRTNSAEQFRINASGGITSVNAADAVGYKGLPQNPQSSAYTLALSDIGKFINITTGGVLIPANGAAGGVGAFPIGAAVSVFNNSASTQSITITTDTLRLAGSSSTGTRTLAAYGVATLLKVATTTWVATGNVS